MHHLQVLAFFDLRGKLAPCSLCELLLTIKEPFTPRVSGFVLCPEGFYKLKKYVLLEEDMKRKESGPAHKKNDTAATCGLATYAISCEC